jgi:hypothetical protein
MSVKVDKKRRQNMKLIAEGAIWLIIDCMYDCSRLLRISLAQQLYVGLCGFESLLTKESCGGVISCV